MADRFRSTCWQSWQEWTTVYRLLYSDESSVDKIEALKIIDVWRSKSEAKLPVAIDCTYILVAASTFSDETNQTTNKDFALRLAIAMALVRFVNGMADQVQKGVYARSIHSVAEELGIPDWLVDVRHDATHSSLPSTEILQASVFTALSWLKENYWEKTYAAINPTATTFHEDIHKLLSQYLCLQWPSGSDCGSFCSRISPELEKKLHSREFIRCCFLPELLKDSLLIPTQEHLQELTDIGNSAPIESFIDLWKPFLMQMHEKYEYFLPELFDFVLNDLSNYGSTSLKARFFIKFLTAFLPEALPFSKESNFVKKLLHHCLQNPSSETIRIVELVNTDATRLLLSQNLWKSVEPFRGIFCFEKAIKSKCISNSENERQLEYFSRNPISGCEINLPQTTDEARIIDEKYLGSWSMAENDWKSIKAGSFTSNGVEIHSKLNILPESVDSCLSKEAELPRSSVRVCWEDQNAKDDDEVEIPLSQNGLCKGDYNLSIF